MEKFLVLVRHGHKDLSGKGSRQAEGLAQWLKGMFKGVPLLLSSPKIRCLETLKEASKIYGMEVRVEDWLDEQRTNESLKEFEERIQSFCEWWMGQGPPFTVVCSHGDWLPRCVAVLTGQPVEFPTGGYMTFVHNGGQVISH